MVNKQDVGQDHSTENGLGKEERVRSAAERAKGFHATAWDSRACFFQLSLDYRW
jgi:hypothetical protein